MHQHCFKCSYYSKPFFDVILSSTDIEEYWYMSYDKNKNLSIQEMYSVLSYILHVIILWYTMLLLFVMHQIWIISELINWFWVNFCIMYYLLNFKTKQSLLCVTIKIDSPKKTNLIYLSQKKFHKDRWDVPHFYVIFLDILFLVY